MAPVTSLRGFAIGALIMEVFFAIIFSLTQGYSPNMSLTDFSGLLATFYLVFLLLIGFGLVTTYLKNFSLGGLTLTFIMLAFTLRFYFLVKNFWVSVLLPDPNGQYTKLGWYFNMIKLNNDNYWWSNTRVTETTLNDAIACAISMFVAMFSLFGRIGPLEVLFLCFAGNFFYTLNEQVFFRLQIDDNGYGSRIFLFGSTLGIVISLILGKKQLTANHANYYSRYNFQTFGLLGAIFVWILIPWLSVIGQGFSTINFNQIAPLNIWYALSSSAIASFIVSIWIKGKIAVHDIVFSCFSGAIAYGASSNVFPHPWPAQLIGFCIGILVTLLNTTKKIDLNENGVVDSLGGLFLFFIPSFVGGIYSAILFASGPSGADYSATTQMSKSYTKYQQGGYQLAGMCITIGIAAATGILLGLIFKCSNRDSAAGQFFDDGHYIQKDDEVVMRRSKIVA